MRIRPFIPEDLTRIRLQASQVAYVSLIEGNYARTLQVSGPALTAEHEGVILSCAGVAYQFFGSGTLWAFMSDGIGPHFIRFDRAARRFLETVHVRRLEATVEKGFEPGCRWLDMLGFEFEGTMRAYGADGKDHLRYARI